MIIMNENFNQKTIEELNYYVYCLIDPRNKKIFYIWKWKNNRVFQHAKWIIEKDPKSEKEELIKEILLQKYEIKYLILRHKLTEKEAYLLESAITDLLSYKNFDFNWVDLKNLVQWHYKSLYWIMSVQEIEAIYWAKELLKNYIKHNLMIININKTYKTWVSLYEATRKSWKISRNKIDKIDYFICEFKGVLRAIFKFDKWIEVKDDKWWIRIEFEWYEITKENDKDWVIDLYINKKFTKKTWDMQVIHYLYKVS